MRLLLALFLILLPLPALADVTARYAAGTDVLLVEVRDNGDWRIDYAGQFGIIRRDGVDYLVMHTEEGARTARLDDLMAIMTAPKASLPPPPSFFADIKLELAAKGEIIIAGRKAILWTVTPKSATSDHQAQAPLEIAISSDPTIAPVGNAFRHVVESVMPFFTMVLPENTGFADRTREILAKGTPLRVGKKLELRSVDSAEIDPKRFELPASPIPAAEFARLFGVGGPPGGGSQGIKPLP